MKNIEVLKTNWDKKPLESIEKSIASFSEISCRNEIELYERLYYLEMTKRFKENTKYKNETFFTYIKDKFHLRKGTYLNKRRAYIQFEAQCVKYGVGLVSKIIRSCTHLNAQKVFNAITNTMNRQQIENVINKHKRPIKDKPKKPNIHALQAQHERDQKTIRDLNKTIKELKAQNKKLKATVGHYQEQMSIPLSKLITPMTQRPLRVGFKS